MMVMVLLLGMMIHNRLRVTPQAVRDEVRSTQGELRDLKAQVEDLRQEVRQITKTLEAHHGNDP